jgi:hypothetical protein
MEALLKILKETPDVPESFLAEGEEIFKGLTRGCNLRVKDALAWKEKATSYALNASA